MANTLPKLPANTTPQAKCIARDTFEARAPASARSIVLSILERWTRKGKRMRINRASRRK